MLAQRTVVSEPFAAHLTLVRFLAGVRSAVRVQLIRLGKPFAAEVAFVLLDALMEQLVPLQVGQVAERF